MLWVGCSHEECGGLLTHPTGQAGKDVRHHDCRYPSDGRLAPARRVYSCGDGVDRRLLWKDYASLYIYNLLEGEFELLLVNAQHIKSKQCLDVRPTSKTRNG